MISWWSLPPGLAGGCCRFVAVSKWQCSQKHPTLTQTAATNMFPKPTTGILKENRLCLPILAFALLTVSLPLHSKLASACRQTGILGNHENHARGKDKGLTIKSHYTHTLKKNSWRKHWTLLVPKRNVVRSKTAKNLRIWIFCPFKEPDQHINKYLCTYIHWIQKSEPTVRTDLHETGLLLIPVTWLKVKAAICASAINISVFTK